MRKILILGGGGFLGLHLSNYLKKKNSITIFQRRKPSLQDFSKDIKFKSLDLSNYGNCLNNIKDFDTVINCAAILKGNNENRIFIQNMKIFLYSFFACINNNVKNYIFISSNNVVAKNDFLKVKNNKSKFKINDGYTLSKVMSEFFLLKLKKNIKVKIIRPSNIYGSKSSSGVIFDLIKKIKYCKKKKLILSANPKSSRNFTYIDDCVKCISLILKKKIDRPINITNDIKVNINDLVTTIKKVLKKDVQIIYKYDRNKIDHKLFNTLYLRKKIKWKDNFSLRKGINNLVKASH